jgi:hypothetical protein
MKSLNQVWVTDNGNQGELVSLAVKPVRGKGGGGGGMSRGRGVEGGGRGWSSFMACRGKGDRDQERGREYTFALP